MRKSELLGKGIWELESVRGIPVSGSTAIWGDPNTSVRQLLKQINPYCILRDQYHVARWYEWVKDGRRIVRRQVRQVGITVDDLDAVLRSEQNPHYCRLYE